MADFQIGFFAFHSLRKMAYLTNTEMEVKIHFRNTVSFLFFRLFFRYLQADDQCMFHVFAKMANFLGMKKRSCFLIPLGLLLALFFGLLAGWYSFKAGARNSSDKSGSQTVTLNLTTIPSFFDRFTLTPLSPNKTQSADTEATPDVAAITGSFIGKPAPDFSLKTFDSREIRLSDLKGYPVLINFWASWCVPCRTEMPAIQSAFEKYKNQGLMVLGVNFTTQDDLSAIRSFVQELKLNFPILLDETGDVITKYRVIGLPTSYFIDRDGSVEKVKIGAMTQEEIINNIEQILR